MRHSWVKSVMVLTLRSGDYASARPVLRRAELAPGVMLL